MYLWKKRQGKLQLFSWKQENTGLLDETKNVAIGKKNKEWWKCVILKLFLISVTPRLIRRVREQNGCL